MVLMRFLDTRNLLHLTLSYIVRIPKLIFVANEIILVDERAGQSVAHASKAVRNPIPVPRPIMALYDT